MKFLVDWFAPIAAFLLGREHVATLEVVWQRAKTRAQNVRLKLESLFGRDVLLRLRSARHAQMVFEGVILLLAVTAWVTGLPGYCTTFRVPGLYLLPLVPAVVMLAWTAVQSFEDRTVRPVPFRLFDGEVYEEDVWEGLPMRAMHVAALHDAGVAHLDLSVEEDQATLTEIIQRVGGPGNRSPKPYAYGLVFGPMVTCGSLLLFSVLIGWNGLFSLNGVRHASLVAIGLLPIFAAVLSGAGYKLVVGVGRAIGLVLVDGSADALTAVVRLLATSFPGITSEDVEKKVPPITGETVKALANLTEGAENKPIAALFLLVVIGALFPHPLVIIVLLAVGAITQARFGNLEANEDPNVKKKRLEEAQQLDVWLKRAAGLVIVLVLVLSLLHDALVSVAFAIVEVINFFMRLGVPSSVTPDNWDWAWAIAGGVGVILVALVIAKAVHDSKLSKSAKTFAWLAAGLIALIICMNWQRKSAYVVSQEAMNARLACPRSGADLAATPPLMIPPLPAVAPAPLPVVPVPTVVPSYVPAAPVAASPRHSRSRATRPSRSGRRRRSTGGTSSRSSGPVSGWTAEECAVLPPGTLGCQ